MLGKKIKIQKIKNNGIGLFMLGLNMVIDGC
jgi:hypothetical protein